LYNIESPHPSNACDIVLKVIRDPYRCKQVNIAESYYSVILQAIQTGSIFHRFWLNLPVFHRKEACLCFF